MSRVRPILLAAGLASALVLGACSDDASDPAPSTPVSTDEAPAAVDEALLTDLGLSDLTGRELVDQLDASADERPLAFTASVRVDEVLVADQSGRETAVPLPDDSFYLSIAPFQTQTHECFFHSLSTCQGELVDTPVTVRIEAEDGTVLVDEEVTTHANGFVGFWLPRDISGTVTVTRGDLTGQVPFATTADSPTCLTTLQLA